MRDGRCIGRLLESLVSLRSAIDFDIVTTAKSNFVDETRNIIVDGFLEGTWKRILFIDADQAFEPNDMVRMLEVDEAVVAAPSVKKEINWKKVHEAIRKQMPYPELAAGNWNFNPASTGAYDINSLVEVSEIGSGIMLIRRDVFEKIEKPYFRDEYIPHHVGEDFAFCRKVRAAGMKIVMAPWVRSCHVGDYVYCSDLRHAIYFSEQEIEEYERDLGAVHSPSP